MADNQNQNQSSNQRVTNSQREQFVADPVQVGLPWRLMIFTFILLLLSIFIFVGLRFGYITYLDTQVETVDTQMEELAAQVSEGEKERFLTFYSQLVNLQTVLDRRFFAQNIFTFLEDRTLPEVYYTDVEYEERRLGAYLSGRTDNMKNFVNQLAIYDESDEVARAILGKLTVNEEGVIFSVNIIFDTEFLRQPTIN